MEQDNDNLIGEGGGKPSEVTQSPPSKADQCPASLQTIVTLEANYLLLTLSCFLLQSMILCVME